uniref:non-specific serine/threonine protein kinase n=1 Tax=Eutreptiella gymnastica TaxID=73025 RepID=A0A7S1HXX6_9EUGL|mmetsp:Transcript_113692/g.197560  ORF Transcript_113692/g.197560 Transcript_113692/m.197560 type:complete len:321 (+) Transcript_113692:108-1070(+)
MDDTKRLVLWGLKYETIKPIGKGAFGNLVLVQDKKDPNMQCVAKIIDTTNLKEKQRDLALNEANVLATLKHPHIIQYKECYTDGDTFYIVMEYAQHGDLYSRIQKQRASTKPGEALATFPVEQTLRWFVQMTTALFYLHSNDIMHRDLKSKNILITDEDDLKIGDFGFSRVLEYKNRTDTVCGTPNYMAPEILANKPYNFKCDVWALGCILYECAMLQYAFVGHGRGGAAQINSLLQKVTKAEYQSLEGFPDEFRCLLEQLLCPDPEQRLSCRKILKLPYVNDHLIVYLKSITDDQVKEIFEEEMLHLNEDPDTEDDEDQ